MIVNEVAKSAGVSAPGNGDTCGLIDDLAGNEKLLDLYAGNRF